MDDLGAVLKRRSFPADSGGYGQLLDWAASLGRKLTFAIESGVPEGGVWRARTGEAVTGVASTTWAVIA